MIFDIEQNVHLVIPMEKIRAQKKKKTYCDGP